MTKATIGSFMASDVVLDASALIALFAGEPGHEIVASRLERAAITTVNIAEVGDFVLRHGGNLRDLDESIGKLEIAILTPDYALALEASALLPPTRSAGLSLADRFCIALARRMDRPALTSDRAWATIADAVSVQVTLIR